MNNNQSGGNDCAALIKSLVDDLTAINRKVSNLSINGVMPVIYAGDLSPL